MDCFEQALRICIRTRGFKKWRPRLPNTITNIIIKYFCVSAGLDEDWGDDAVLNQVLAVSQHEYLRSLQQQQQQQEQQPPADKVNKTERQGKSIQQSRGVRVILGRTRDSIRSPGKKSKKTEINHRTFYLGVFFIF